MTPLDYAWLIPLLPALGFVINILFGYRLGKRGGAYVSVALLAVSSLLATDMLVQVSQASPLWFSAGIVEVTHAEEDLASLEIKLVDAQREGATMGTLTRIRSEIGVAEEDVQARTSRALIREAAPDFPFTAEIPWLAIRGEVGIPFGFLLDPLAALMTFMVAFVSLLIHLFSLEYMAGEERYPTFFAYIGLFAAAMIGMVMSKNLFHVLLFWELMGVMSYLLIGFFYQKIAAQQAMKKAFLVTKVADLAFLLAVFWVYRAFGTLDIPTLQELAPGLSTGVAAGIGLLLLVGAMGKSAQFPLHVWLLDAMEGPTPVSAMIHAATMVAAGVFLLARAYPILEAGHVLPVVATVGAFTALFAAVLAPAFADIKKILAWSTVSQLGFMFLALGAFGWVAAVFHLVAHAFFKALLFLCSGSMIHGSGTQDIFEMDRLKNYMPTTRWTFIIGALSLAGVVPFAGFWSKDEILLAVSKVDGFGYDLLLVMAYAASLLTAFYITRAYLIAFEKPRRESPWNRAPWNEGGLAELGMTAEDVEHDLELEPQHVPETPHESGWRIGTALWLLAGGAVIIGLMGSLFFGNALQLFVYPGSVPQLEPLSAQIPGFIVGTLVALAGIAAAWLLYGSERLKVSAPVPLTRLLQRRFYLDELYYTYIAKPLTRLAKPMAWVDRRILDGLIDGAAWLVVVLGDALRRGQTGKLEHYAWTIAAAAVLLVFAFGVAL